MDAPNPIPDKISLSEIDETGRVREEHGDLSSLEYSIKNFGLIQPLVVTWDENRWKLLAGGRRYLALKKLGRTDVIHGKEILVREELYDSNDPEVVIIRQTIELEENLKRKDMTWPEQVEGKRRLLELMQQRHGARTAGGATRAERAGTDTIEQTGFSLRKLADQLGESAANTSKDIQLAQMLRLMPRLAEIDTKTAAMRRLDILMTTSQMKRQAKPDGDKPYILYRGDTLANTHNVSDASVDLIVTDLPFGVGLEEMSRHASGALGYDDSRAGILAILPGLLTEAYRMLRDDRYAVFFFGFNYYTELSGIATTIGFNVNLVPFVWYKNTRSTENPNTRYGNSYDPALVMAKGSPVFVRPGQANYLAAAPVVGKIQVAQQPVEVPERFILDMTGPGAIVVDLTAGTGTTGEACIRNKRFPILFEQDASLCDYITGRLDGLKL